MNRAMAAATNDLAPQAQRLTRLYILALSAVACLSICGQLLVQWSLDRQLSDSRVVNLAGRQRMLSQRLTKSALALERASSPEEVTQRRKEMSDALAEWRRADEGLRQGDPLLGLPGRNSSAVQKMFAELEPHFRAIDESAENVLNTKGENTAAIDQLLANEPQFLSRMNAIVIQYEHEARHRVSWLKGIERSLLLLTLVVLACEGVLIFRPAIRRLRLTAAATEESRRQLEIARQMADSASAAKSRFLATISHELRNPLQAIIGSVELANQTMVDAIRLAHLETIGVAARALLVLFNDLLDLARIEAGKLAIVSAPFDAVRLTEQTLGMVQSRADAKGLRLDWQLPQEISRSLDSDEIRVQQVLLNLLTNAVKFTPSGKISVRLTSIKRDPESVWLRWEVSDTGIGIADDKQSVIFDHFTQIEDNAARKGGAGLGLAISKRLVELMLGEIGVESKLGEGSTFWFELPLDSSAEGTPVPIDRNGQPVIVQPKSVLLVDDDPVNLRLLSQLVESLGHRVVAARGGAEAISAFRGQSFDTTILDWQMPEMNGGQVAYALRAIEREWNRPGTRIIALSAAVERESSQDPNRCCFDLWLTKPVSQAGLAKVLGNVEMLVSCSEVCASRWAQPLARLGGRRPLLAQLAQTWSAGLPEILEGLQDAMNEGRAQDVARLAHLLSGQASIFAAQELISVAKSLEELALANVVECSLVSALEDQCRKLNGELAPWLAAAR
jgi:signal transduction histidine kinase/DNA-binding NarL/FixJ family response regulator